MNELIYDIDRIDKLPGHIIAFHLSTRDEHTIRELETKYKHKLTTDGFKYFFMIQFHISEFKTIGEKRMWDSVKEFAPDMAKDFVLARIKGKI